MDSKKKKVVWRQQKTKENFIILFLNSKKITTTKQ